MAEKKLPKAALDFFRKKGKEGGLLSSEARMEKMTTEQRKAVARKAAAASVAVRQAKAAARKAAAKKAATKRPGK